MKHGITYQILRFDFRVRFGQMFTDNLSQVLHALVLRVLEIVLVNCETSFVSKYVLSFIYIFIVDNLELESKNGHSILMGESLLDGVVVDVPVDQM